MQDITALTAEREQLAARIAEIDALIAQANAASGYGLTEESGRWQITRNGKPVAGRTYSDRQLAEDMVLGLSSISEDYTLSYEPNDRRSVECVFVIRKGSRRVGMGRDIHRAIAVVAEDIAAIPGRIARAAERAVEAEAEQIAVAEAERVAAERAKLATPRQVEFIMTLLAEREFKLSDPGFIIGGPTGRADVEKLTKEQASAYITSLKGDY